MRLLGFRHPRPVTDWTQSQKETIVITDEVGTPSMFEADAVEAQPATSSPEVQQALARLAAVDPTLVSPELRDVTLQQARTAAFASRAREHLAGSQRALEAAVVAQDMALAHGFAAELAAAERVLSVLPAAEDSAPAAAPCLALAREKLDQAVGVLPAAPLLSASVEMADYKSLPPELALSVDPPSLTAADRQRAVQVESFAFSRRIIVEGVADWRRAATLGLRPALDLLAEVGGLVETCEAITREGFALQVEVDEANAARARDGNEWSRATSKNPVARAWSSAETRALDRHRQSMAL
jgi:hypothetical protein